MRRTISGPALVKSSLPILNAPTTGASCTASCTAVLASGTSKATMTGFCMRQLNLNHSPRQVSCVRIWHFQKILRVLAWTNFQFLLCCASEFILIFYMFADVRSVHFIGIGGTAMASAAAAMREKGFTVTGSDQNVYPPMSTFLEQQKIPFMSGYAESNLAHKPDLVVV